MEDVFLSTGLPLAEEKPRGPEEPAETLPGSPDLRDLTHPEIGSWREFRATLKPIYWRAWAEISFCLAMLLGGYATHFGLAWHLGNLAGMAAAPLFARADPVRRFHCFACRRLVDRLDFRRHVRR
jgi:hypothetical protein